MNAYTGGQARATTSSSATARRPCGTRRSTSCSPAARASSSTARRSTRPPGRSSSFATRPCGATRAPRSPGRPCSPSAASPARLHAVGVGVVLRGRALPRPARHRGRAAADGRGERALPGPRGGRLLDGLLAGARRTRRRGARRRSAARSSSTRVRASGLRTTTTSRRSATASASSSVMRGRSARDRLWRDLRDLFEDDDGSLPRYQRSRRSPLEDRGVAGPRAPLRSGGLLGSATPKAGTRAGFRWRIPARGRSAAGRHPVGVEDGLEVAQRR